MHMTKRKRSHGDRQMKLCLKNRTGETPVTKYSSRNSKTNGNKSEKLLPYFVMFLLSNYIRFLF